MLKSAATRGDGKVGEDVTANVRTIESVPLTLTQNVDVITEGEVWLPKKQLARINVEREKAGETLFANPRNAAAGSIRQLDPKIAASRKLSTFIYDLSAFDGDMPGTQAEELKLLSTLGFKVNKNFILAKNIDEVISFWKEWEKKNKSQDYQLDGIVIKVNNREHQEILAASRSPGPSGSRRGSRSRRS